MIVIVASRPRECARISKGNGKQKSERECRECREKCDDLQTTKDAVSESRTEESAHGSPIGRSGTVHADWLFRKAFEFTKSQVQPSLFCVHQRT